MVKGHKVKNEKIDKKIAFGWYGGKFSHLDWLLPLLPETDHFCEPFGGSAAVIINRNPSLIETYNDLDGEVVNFFRVLREHPNDLIRQIGLTPFSREEFKYAIEHEDDKNLSDIERARSFFIRARQVRTGLAQKATSGRWANCKLTSRAGMSGAVSRWLGSVDGLTEIAERLLRIQIENAPAIEVVRRYDSPQTLFYCDPPYTHDSRGDINAYKFEMDRDAHVELAETLKQVKGLVAISGYDSPLMNELYQGWKKIAGPVKNANSIQQPRQEILWVNYNINDKSLWKKQQRSLI
ncbi:DNA adenine methylase [Patescibacteria group bacterium]|nr:MAG: DNA adenine methylase [Patescibacteria group bacterium]